MSGKAAGGPNWHDSCYAGACPTVRAGSGAFERAGAGICAGVLPGKTGSPPRGQDAASGQGGPRGGLTKGGGGYTMRYTWNKRVASRCGPIEVRGFEGAVAPAPDR